MWARRFCLCVMCALLVLGAARSSTGEPVVIYSNFGASPGYLPQGWESSEENNYYMGFQLNETALLRSVTLPVEWLGGAQPADFSVAVFSSRGGAPDISTGGMIERMVVPFPADPPSGTIMMLTFLSSLQPMLSASTLYFIDAIPTRIRSGPGGSFAFGTLWPWNNAGIQGSVVSNSPAGLFISQGTLGAFQLTGELSPTPEPATMALFATGAGLMLRRVRRRRA
jgi:hypothetical protein